MCKQSKNGYRLESLWEGSGACMKPGGRSQPKAGGAAQAEGAARAPARRLEKVQELEEPREN